MQAKELPDNHRSNVIHQIDSPDHTEISDTLRNVQPIQENISSSYNNFNNINLINLKAETENQLNADATSLQANPINVDAKISYPATNFVNPSDKIQLNPQIPDNPIKSATHKDNLILIDNTPLSWNLEQTLAWLENNELEDFVELFKDYEIYGAKFLELDHKILRNLDVFSYKDRVRLIKSIRRDFYSECPNMQNLSTQDQSGIKIPSYGSPQSSSLTNNSFSFKTVCLDANCSAPCSHISQVNVNIDRNQAEIKSPDSNVGEIVTLSEHDESGEVIREITEFKIINDSETFANPFTDPTLPPLYEESSVDLSFGQVDLDDNESFCNKLSTKDSKGSLRTLDEFDLTQTAQLLNTDSYSNENTESVSQELYQSNNRTDSLNYDFMSNKRNVYSTGLRASLYRNNSNASISAPDLSKIALKQGKTGSNDVRLPHQRHRNHPNSLDNTNLPPPLFDPVDRAVMDLWENELNTLESPNQNYSPKFVPVQPIITPRKESMVNLNRTLKVPTFKDPPNFKTNEMSKSVSNRNSIISSAPRRSSLFYDIAPLAPTQANLPKRQGFAPPSRTDNSVIKEIPVSSSLHKLEIVPIKTNPFVEPSSQLSKVGNTKKSTTPSPSSENSSFFNILPDFLNPFSKHHRKHSTGDMKFDSSKVIQVSLETGGVYSVNIGGCATADEVYQCILRTLLIDGDGDNYQIEEFLLDGKTRIVSPRYLLDLCRKTDHKGYVKLQLTKVAQRKYSTEGKKPRGGESSRAPLLPITPNDLISATLSPQVKPAHTTYFDRQPQTVATSPPVELPGASEIPSWAQLWGERPSTDVITTNLEKFFPNHDLDKPIIDAGVEGSEPEAVAKNPVIANIAGQSGLGRKKSIRMVVQEAHQRRISSDQSLSRRCTRMWGTRTRQVGNDSGPRSRTKASEPNTDKPVRPQSPDKPYDTEDIEAFFEDLMPKSYPAVQWVKGKIIGKGSFGRVFHALNAVTGDMIAVKVIELPSSPTNSKRVNQAPLVGRKRGDFIRELYREIELLKDLDHDNVVQYLGFEVNPTSLNIFLEYISGGSIASALLRSGPFEDQYASALLKQILKGLAYLHGRNIMHRDIKGANVLINHEGVCKITDFGISRRSDLVYRNDVRLSFKGSVFWMAPEVVTNQGYSAKVDIWSLGCLLIEMLTGQRPWRELAELTALYKLGQSTTESTPPIPDHLAKLTVNFLNQCFIIDPDSRPTAVELLEHDYCKS